MSRPNEPIDYASASPPQPLRITQVLAGCMTSSVVIGLSAFLAGYLSFGIGYGERGRPGLAALVFIAVVCAALCLVGLMLACTRRDPSRRGYHVGLWIGFGLGLLGSGLCFAAL